VKLYPLSLTDKISINAESISTKLRLNTLTKSVDKDIDALIIGKGISFKNYYWRRKVQDL